MNVSVSFVCYMLTCLLIMINCFVLKVKMATCVAGKSHCIYLKITNNFPEMILAESVSIAYSPFAPVAVRGGLPTEQHSSSSSSSSFPEETNMNMDINAAADSTSSTTSTASGDNKSFFCFPFPDYFNEDDVISLQPGVTIIGMQFTPPCCGEFSPTEINIKFNSSVSFKHTIVSDLNKLHPFFDENMIIDVISPKKALKIQPFPSTFTPSGHSDVGGIFIIPEPTDTLKSIFIHAQCVSKKDRVAFNTEKRTRKDSISLVSDRMSTMSVSTSTSAPVAHTDTYTTPPQDSNQSIPVLSSSASLQQVVLDAPKKWVFQCVSNDDDTESSENPNVVVQKGGLLITNIPQNVTLNLKTFFHTSQLQLTDNTDSNPCDVDECDLIFSVEGQIIRNGCMMGFELQVEHDITVGLALDISQETTELLGTEYFAQCVLRNISFIPWKVHDFVTGAGSGITQINNNKKNNKNGVAGVASFVLVKDFDKSMTCDTDNDNESDSEGHWKEVAAINNMEEKEEKDDDDGFILYPGDCFHVAMHLRQARGGLNTDMDMGMDVGIGMNSGAIQLLRGVFPIQRCYDCITRGAGGEGGGGDNDNTHINSHKYGARDDIANEMKIYEFYNTTLFEHSLAVSPPRISPLVYSLDYQLRAFEAPSPTFSSSTASLTGSEESSVVYTLGEPIPVTYELDVIFPSTSTPTSTSTSGSTSEPASSSMCVILVLSFTCTHDWAVLGKSTRVVHCSSQVHTR